MTHSPTDNWEDRATRLIDRAFRWVPVAGLVAGVIGLAWMGARLVSWWLS